MWSSDNKLQKIKLPIDKNVVTIGLGEVVQIMVQDIYGNNFNEMMERYIQKRTSR